MSQRLKEWTEKFLNGARGLLLGKVYTFLNLEGEELHANGERCQFMIVSMWKAGNRVMRMGIGQAKEYDLNSHEVR